MNDLYRILGLSHDASAQEIKKAYRRLSLSAHPDRGGNQEQMGLLNEAYETLSDPDKRRRFDELWRLYQEVDVDLDQENEVVICDRITSNSLPYSHQFRQQHESLSARHIQTPLNVREAQPLEPFQSSMYSFTAIDDDAPVQTLHDVFTLIRKKTEQEIQQAARKPSSSDEKVNTTIEHPPLSVELASKHIMKFLSGDYFGSELIAFNGYLADQIRKIKQRNSIATELELYEGFFELTLIATQDAPTGTLIYSVNKITNFAKAADTSVLSHIIPLLFEPLFRTLYAQALHLYWQEHHNLDALKSYDGMQEAKEFFITLKERLKSDSSNENLGQVIRYVKLLYKYEKDSHRTSQHQPAAELLREEAFQSLDWTSFLLTQGSRSVLINHFLQIGLKFQNASRLEDNAALHMSDEHFALKMYLTAVGIAQHVTPDLELYAMTHIMQYLASFKYQADTLNEVILSLKNRTLQLANIFPFFELPQSNIVFLREERKGLHLMRVLLHTLTKIYQDNKHLPEIAQVLRHAPADILYQSYEACLKNWYQEEYNPALEKQFRIDLMVELLFENNWTFLNVEERLNYPWIMVDRDKESWITPTRQLPYKENSIQYKTINGAEVDYKTGRITFFMTPWTQGRPVYEKVFSQFDLQELLEKNIGGALFSLDPADPLKPYHPFNAMRFSPSTLAESG